MSGQLDCGDSSQLTRAAHAISNNARSVAALYLFAGLFGIVWLCRPQRFWNKGSIRHRPIHSCNGIDNGGYSIPLSLKVSGDD